MSDTYRNWDEVYKTWAMEIAASVGGHPSDVENWLRDGDFDPRDDIEEYKKEWEERGCTYEA